MISQDTGVIIVGGGPCGLMLANELGRRDVPTVLFDQDPGTSEDPKGNAIQARTMEHFRRLGFADSVRSEGLPTDYPTDIAYFTRYAHHELARFELPSSGEARNLVKNLSGSWSTPELPHRCTQMIVERILRKQAETHPSVSLRYGWHVSKIADEGDHVVINASDGAQTVRFSGKYLMGCDGARSRVRKHLGVEYAGESGVVRDFMGGRMHAIYLRAPHLYDQIAGKPAWMYWTFNRDRRSFMAAVDGKSEFVFHTQLKPDEANETIDTAKARAMFAEAFGKATDFEILSRDSWTAGFALVAEKFRQGRIFIAGDAAHLFTPTGGLGYNTAVDDAVNLGWKLAAVLNGWGGPGLLESYETERRPLALRNTAYARGFADSIGLYAAPPELEEDSPAGEGARAEAGAYLEKHARAEFNIPGITFGGRYDGSPLIVSDGSAPPPDQANTYVPTACPGGRAPHLWLQDGRSLYDALGFEFSLLRLRGRVDIRPLSKAAEQRGLPLTIVDVPGDEARDLYGADLALIRPDQVVAWRGGFLPDDPEGLLNAVTGNA